MSEPSGSDIATGASSPVYISQQSSQQPTNHPTTSPPNNQFQGQSNTPEGQANPFSQSQSQPTNQPNTSPPNNQFQGQSMTNIPKHVHQPLANSLFPQLPGIPRIPPPEPQRPPQPFPRPDLLSTRPVRSNQYNVMYKRSYNMLLEDQRKMRRIVALTAHVQLLENMINESYARERSLQLSLLLERGKAWRER